MWKWANKLAFHLQLLLCFPNALDSLGNLSVDPPGLDIARRVARLWNPDRRFDRLPHSRSARRPRPARYVSPRARSRHPAQSRLDRGGDLRPARADPSREDCFARVA